MATDNSTRKLVKSEITTIRLDPKLKYLAELAARKQRRTLSSYIEWAVDQSLASVVLEEGEHHRITVADMTDRLWDVDEGERFVRLAISYPELLTHEEQELWKMLLDSGTLESARSRDPSGRVRWSFAVLEDRVFPALRADWHEIKTVFADGPTARQQWISTVRRPPRAAPAPPPRVPVPRSAPKPSSGFDDVDEDIKF